MITRCNQCDAKFEISAELVQSEDPTVRCGECLSVFDARAQLVSEDSISNYRGARTSERQQTGRRKTPAPLVTPASTASRAPVTTSNTVVTDSVTADNYAHISDDDLENAATVVIDHASPENDLGLEHAAAPADNRINDGYYSPDLSIDPMDNQRYGVAKANLPGRANGKTDPTINLAAELDSTNLEFERTLALGSFTTQDDAAAGAIADQRLTSGNTASPNSPVTSRDQMIGEEDETVRLMDDPSTNEEWLLDPEHSSAQSHTVTADAEPGVIVGRDYPHISDGVLAERHEAFDPHSETADPDRHLSAEDLGLEPNDNTPGAAIPEADYQGADHAQDSASDLRRYVTSRGGDIYPKNEKEAHQAQQRSRSPLLPLLSVCLIIAGVLYFARTTIATMNLPEPVLSAFCSVTGCELPVQKDIEQLELVRHQMSSHKTLDEVLVFTVDLINRAQFPQPYPILVVTMANSGGESVAFRKFQPDEYLEEDPLLKTLPAGKPVRIKFEIVDPGPEALSSELSFE